MEPIRIKLAILWIMLMLIYLLGDVLRIFSGDFTAGDLGGIEAGQGAYLGMAAMMLMPILMVGVSVFLGQKAARLTSIIVSAFFFLLNAVGLPTYPSLYDKFLLAVSLVVNVLTVLLVWRWV